MDSSRRPNFFTVSQTLAAPLLISKSFAQTRNTMKVRKQWTHKKKAMEKTGKSIIFVDSSPVLDRVSGEKTGLPFGRVSLAAYNLQHYNIVSKKLSLLIPSSP